MQTLIRHHAAEQLSNVQLREWQKYRGWSIKIMAELEHVDAETTRIISDATGCNPKCARNTLCRMLKAGLVERVERWGWRITRDGIFVLLLQQHTTTTPQPHHKRTTSAPQEKEEPVPSCFRLATCHIRRLLPDKLYNEKNRWLCHGTACCIFGAAGRDRVPVEMKGAGSA